MPEQTGYYTLTEDIKTLIQYVQEQAFDHLVVEAANRLNKAIKKGVDVGLAAITIKEYRDTFDEEKQQYAEDSKNHERPWELWQYAIKTPDVLDWDDCPQPPPWHKYCAYRRKPYAVIPEYYSGLNWHDAEHLIGKTVECTNNPDTGWSRGILVLPETVSDTPYKFAVKKQAGLLKRIYIRTCEETFKHPTINIGGVELPMPETVAPNAGDQYWVCPSSCEPSYILFWNNDDDDIAALRECRVHLTKENAQAWADWWKKEVLAKIEEIGS